MSAANPEFVSKVSIKWQLTLLTVGSAVLLVIFARGAIFQFKNLFSSILLLFGGVITIITLIFLVESIRQKESRRFSSPFFKAGLALSILEIYAIIFLVSPPVGFIDLILLSLLSFIISTFIHSTKSLLVLSEDHLNIISLTGKRDIKWSSFITMRWLDQGTFAILVAEYPKEIYIPLFTHTNRDQILDFFCKKIDKKNTNIDYFLRNVKK